MENAKSTMIRVSLNVLPSVKMRLEKEAAKNGLTVNAYMNYIIMQEFKQLDALNMSKLIETTLEEKLKKFSEEIVKAINKNK